MNIKKILDSGVTTLVLVALVAVFGIHVITRNTQGVRLIRLQEGDRLVGLDRIEALGEDDREDGEDDARLGDDAQPVVGRRRGGPAPRAE